jgi:maltooligosyltrehalose synthase
LFEDGEYMALHTGGAHRDCAFAFARALEGSAAIVCVPRLIASLVPDAVAPIGKGVWGDTRVELPPNLVRRVGGAAVRDVFTGATFTLDSALAAAELFEQFPVALLLPS